MMIGLLPAVKRTFIDNFVRAHRLRRDRAAHVLRPHERARLPRSPVW